MTIKRLIYSLSFLVILLFIGCKQANRPQSDHYVSETLATIPLQDRQKLENFFDFLIKDSLYPYTLFGDKPCSFANYWNLTKYPRSNFLTQTEYVILEEGWDCWVRYKYLFPSDNYFMRKITYKDTPHVNLILIINKKALKSILNLHALTFQKIMSLNSSTEEVMIKIEKEDQFLADIFDHAELLGILLGYGEVNAKGFETRASLCERLDALIVPPIDSSILDLSAKSQCFLKAYGKKDSLNKVPLESLTNASFLSDELNELTEQLTFFELEGSDFFPEEILTPTFAAIQKHDDTIQLYDSYQRTREKILDAYTDKPLIEVTLNQWMKKRSDL